MRTIAEIEIIPKHSSIVDSIEFSQCPNPVSKYGKILNGDTLAEFNQPYRGARPFLTGASLLNNGDKFWNSAEKYEGYIGSVLSSDGVTPITLPNCKHEECKIGQPSVGGDIVVDEGREIVLGKTLALEKGEFPHGGKVAITVTGSNIHSLVILFDQDAGQWATHLTVNDVPFVNDGPQFVWVGDLPADKVTIVIDKWNAPGYPVRITGVLNSLTMWFDSHSIKEIVRGSQSMTDNTKPKFGVLTQYGSMSLYDVDEEFREFAEMGLLRANMPMRIYLEDDNSKEIVGTYISEKWSYDYKNKEVKVDMTDITSTWSQQEFFIPAVLSNIYLVEVEGLKHNCIEIFEELISASNVMFRDCLADNDYQLIKELYNSVNGAAKSANKGTSNALEEITRRHSLKNNKLKEKLGKIFMFNKYFPRVDLLKAWKYFCEFIGANMYCDAYGIMQIVFI